MNGFTGLDAGAALALLEGRGVSRQFATLFLPYWEAGMFDAAEEQRKEKT